MIERRNFYRILYVQPDASIAVIGETYRILMQKLKTYPDLCDSNWNRDLLNLAYDTLRDPIKRADYDYELLERYHITILSQGGLGSYGDFRPNSHGMTQPIAQNQRNYYRILQVQPDAPIIFIKASYQALKNNSSHDIRLLDEAYRILSNPATRKEYDVLFAALNSAKMATAKNISQSVVKSYQPLISHYCSFCKTPYMPQANMYQIENCLECESPLLIWPYENVESYRRTMRRVGIRGEFIFYLFWPSKPYQGSFQDLSPTGVCFLTEESIDSHSIIKIDAPNFQAVAEVVHQHNIGKKFSIGTRFIAMKFDQQRGNFITTNA